MVFRLSNSNWPKIAQDLYFNKFLPDYRSGRFAVSDETFSNLEVLDCLESETSSLCSVSKSLKKLLDNKQVDSIVVVGAGSGRLGTQILKQFSQIILYEVDKNPIVVDRLQNKYNNEIHRKPILGEACKLPLKTASTDVILCYGVFRYINNIRESLDEFMRVLKDNGKIIISEAKDVYTMEKIKASLKQQKIKYETMITPTIRLPHLTFFYYLVHQYGYDKEVTQVINEAMINGKTMVQAAFLLAGCSLGSIYTVILEKSK